MRSIIRAGMFLLFIVGLASSAHAQPAPAAEPLRNVPVSISQSGDDLRGQAFATMLRARLEKSPTFRVVEDSSPTAKITVTLTSVPIRYDDSRTNDADLGSAIAYTIVAVYDDPTELPRLIDGGVLVVADDGPSLATKVETTLTRSVREYRDYIRTYNAVKRAERERTSDPNMVSR